ncbi:MAG: ATP-dependent DNA helicase RecG [Aquificaceae bacterium]|nr:MAG: ATP-dependent DNA helicase RecG [Aquificaceae bacterium]
MSSNNPLLANIDTIKGVGPKIALHLEKLGLEKIQDLLFHLPLRYQDRTRVYPLSSVRHGQEVLIEGQVDHCSILFKQRRMMICQLSDESSGSITLRFFHFSNAQKLSFSTGTWLRCFGEIHQGFNSLEIVHPEYKIINKNTPLELADSLTPTYPSTKGLQQRTLRRLNSEAIKRITYLDEIFPESLREQYKLMTLAEALVALHQPTPESSVEQLLSTSHPAQQRLIFEELIAHHLSLRKFREYSRKVNGITLSSNDTLNQKLLKSLPFELTGAQQRVINELKHDMQQPWPMSRLVQGDVGSGKTLVAAAAALTAIEAGYQVALMVPTEILAEQHLKSFMQWFKPLGLRVDLLSGRQKAAERRNSIENITLGLTNLAIGTHALFQDSVKFQKLGLLIIDEQHRFGVHQRLALREKGKQGDLYPHQLVMTATPIPRTLAMTAYADMDYSVIDELPPGRTPVKTVVIPNIRRDDIVQRINTVCQQGAQVYWVCTLIEESDALQCQNAEETLVLLQESLPELNIGLVHGRMTALEKETTMQSFKAAELHLLVATTVIEVGVDVPNASLMIIENAERLGLAQLHQLRGRVGRGTAASSCVLMYQSPLSQIARKRLDALRSSNDGFEIARIDLEIRGPGEVFGTRQTGELQFRIADLLRDQHLLPSIQAAAEVIIKQYPDRIQPLIERWIKTAENYVHA